ncbi:MAG: biotin--[acetyl-CoA-carboxylase] ligase [Desulfobulbus sp.]|nr:biotin--[acetyl-CoA-carboxylase] ligase [Desulfobulbus sp.]
MIVRYDHIDSTNRVAKDLVTEDAAPSGTIVWSDTQSAGRGQYERVFDSPKGGLYFSLILEPALPFEHLPLITLATGLACLRVLKSQYGFFPLIKWPNDIYLGDKKLAGILCENVIKPHPGGSTATVIIGVGMNVNNITHDFAAEIQPVVTTLFDHLHIPIALDGLLASLVSAIAEQVARLEHDRSGLLAEWQQADLLFGRPVVYMRDNQSVVGTGHGITGQGAYKIHEESGIEHQVIGGQLRLRTT